MMKTINRDEIVMKLGIMYAGANLKIDKEMTDNSLDNIFNIATTLNELAANMIKEVRATPVVDAAEVVRDMWVPVSEHLPEPNIDVLVSVFDGYDTYTDVDALSRDGKWRCGVDSSIVTHWMPLPKPPKET